MKVKLWFLAFLVIMGQEVAARKNPKIYAVGFYNQENLFDTCHDAGKNDYEYLPAKGWNSMKYTHKLRNMSRALADMGTDVLPGTGCALIGLAEVENDRVLDDLTAQPPLRERGIRYVHVEGPDRRGIDCALLYNPRLFRVKHVRLVPYVQELAKDSTFYTRGFLTVRGKMAGQDLAVIVCHLPSRFSSSFYRESGARQVRAVKDSLLRENPRLKIMVMGDMNDDPMDASMHRELRAKAWMTEVGQGDMYNPWYNVLALKGKGTLYYRGHWNLFDQIVLSPNLLDASLEKVDILSASPSLESAGKDGKTKTQAVKAGAKRQKRSDLRFLRNEVFRRDYLLQQNGPYRGTPLRTQVRSKWLDGYSDHLPVIVYLVKGKIKESR